MTAMLLEEKMMPDATFGQSPHLNQLVHEEAHRLREQELAAALREQARRKETVILRLKIGRPGTTKKADASKIDFEGADESLFKVSKNIFESPELDAVQSHDNKVRAYVARRSFPADGGRRIPAGLLLGVLEQWDAWRAERLGLIEIFRAAYPRLIDAARGRLGRHFDEADYPPADELCRRFTFDYAVRTESVPDALKSLDAGLFQQEAKKMQQAWAEETEQMKLALRTRFVAIVEAMHGALTVDPQTGKPKRFSRSLIENWNEFTEIFEGLDVAGDAELAALVDRSRSLMQGLSPDDLKKSGETREVTQASVAEIRAEMEAMLVRQTQAQGRTFSFDEDL